MPGRSITDPIDTVEKRCPLILRYAQLQAVEMCIRLPVFLYLTGKSRGQQWYLEITDPQDIGIHIVFGRAEQP